MRRLYEKYDTETFVDGHSIYRLASIVCKGIIDGVEKDIIDNYLYGRIEDIEREFLGTSIRSLPLSFSRIASIRGSLINEKRNSDSIYDAYNIANGYSDKPIFDKDTELLTRAAIEALIIQIKRQRELYRNNSDKLGAQALLPEEKRDYFHIDHIEKMDYIKNNISEIIEHIESRITTEGSLFIPTENKSYGHRGILIQATRPLIYVLADYTTLDLLRCIRDKNRYRNAFDTLFINKTK
jgi:hypothetical protein